MKACVKACVKATGEIVDVHRLCASSQGDIWQKKSGREYFFAYELDFDAKEPSKPRYNPDYWTRLEHTYAGMAMQGVVNSFNNRYRDSRALRSCITREDSEKLLKESAKAAADVCYYFARALVEKMKEE